MLWFFFFPHLSSGLNVCLLLKICLGRVPCSKSAPSDGVINQLHWFSEILHSSTLLPLSLGPHQSHSPLRTSVPDKCCYEWMARWTGWKECTKISHTQTFPQWITKSVEKAAIWSTSLWESQVWVSDIGTISAKQRWLWQSGKGHRRGDDNRVHKELWTSGKVLWGVQKK